MRRLLPLVPRNAAILQRRRPSPGSAPLPGPPGQRRPLSTGDSDGGADDAGYRDWILNPRLREHLRPSLAGLDIDDGGRDTGFAVTFLGTGAGRATPRRSNPATALRRGADLFLFDAGEGVQRQLMRSRLNLSKVRKIFITHLHGDHIFGLPGLLLSLQTAAKAMQEARRPVVEIYGPVGVFNFVAATLSLSASELMWLTVRVFELRDDDGADRQAWRHPGAFRTYPEFRHRGLERRAVPRNADGTWTLEVPREIETVQDALERSSSAPEGAYIHAALLRHVPKVQCLGYVVREPRTQPWNIDKDKAVAAGVKPGKKYKLLKAGFPVMSDDGSRQVEPHEVLVGERAVSRSVAVLGDCYMVPPPMLELCKNVDVLVHEATFMEGETGNRIDFGGHSTAAMAAVVANKVQAKCLFLNHIASGSFLRTTEQKIVREAENALKHSLTTQVQIAYDHLEFQHPRTRLNW